MKFLSLLLGCLISCGFLGCRETETSSAPQPIHFQITNAYGPDGLNMQQVQPQVLFTDLSIQAQTALQVSYFKLSVGGPDFTTLQATAQPGAGSIRIEDVPPGTGRWARVEAFNSSQQLLRQDEVRDIAVILGQTTQVQMALETVPMALNLHDGALVWGQQSTLIGFGEPGGLVAVESETPDFEVNWSLNSDVGGAAAPALVDGLFAVSLAGLPEGPQELVLRDQDTGQERRLSIHVVSGQWPGTAWSAWQTEDLMGEVSSLGAGDEVGFAHEIREAVHGEGE